MYTENTSIGELLELPQVMALLEKAAPQMVSGPAKGYLPPLTLAQLKVAQPESAQLADAILALANGADVDLTPLDPSKKKPILKGGSTVAQYDIDDVDGKMYMLNHAFSGCFILSFSKPIDEHIKGQVTYDGIPVKYILSTMSIAGGVQLMGVYVRDICTQYGTDYTFHFEGFTDTDGNVMDPQDYIISTVAKNLPDPAYAAHEAIAQKAAEEGMVLLKNDNGLLPLVKDAKLAVIGEENFRDGAVGAGKINPRYHVRLGQALADSNFILTEDADTCLFVISRASGENFDNGTFQGEFYLTDAEEKQICEAKKKYAHIIAIINSGYPMDVRWTLDVAVEAVIWTGFSGMLGGKALVNILNGTTNPSGKLPDSWSLDYFDIPSAHNFYVAPSAEESVGADDDIWIDTVYEEDIYVGYRYFETFKKDVAYAFGHGLSYTNFAIQSLCTGQDLSHISISATVTNTGKVSGKEVVEIYATIPDGKLEQPALRLVAFSKTSLLAAGASEILTLDVPVENLASYDEERHAFITEAGEYHFYCGDDIHALTEVASITATETQTIKIVGDYMKPPVDFTRLSKKDENTYPSGKKSGIIADVHELQHKTIRANIPDTEAIDDSFIDDWSVEELARFSVCASSGWGMQDVGVAGRIYQLEGRDIPYFAVADGNNGVNINKPNIGMPTSNLVCASWNPDLAYQVGRVIAEEARENNVQMILAPAMNLHRNPLCGRHPEYFSEDPLLGGIMAGNQCKGLEENAVSASIKHVCCNNAESSRKRNHSIVSQRALRELYLRTFEVAFDIHIPDSIMTGYNACNGVFTAEDEEMIQGIFRNEFGFNGYVMTDWNSYDTADVAKAIAAGNCWMTPGTTDDTYVSPIIEGIKNGTISENRLRQNIKYMYRVIRKRTQA